MLGLATLLILQAAPEPEAPDYFQQRVDYTLEARLYEELADAPMVAARRAQP